MEILAVAVGRLADPDAARPAQNALDFRHEPFRLAQKRLVPEVATQGHEKDEPEGVSPEIAQAVRPDALLAHPVEFREDVIDVAEHAS